MNKRLILLLLAPIFTLNLFADPIIPATNKDGSLVNGILEAAFDPSGGVLPFPSNLAFPTSGPIDLTLNIPSADPNDPGDPRVALSALDGFSTTEKWTTTFIENLGGFPPVIQPGEIDPASVTPGQSVRVFEITTTGYPYLGVTGITRELVGGAEFTAVAAGNGILAIVPLVPLKEFTTYMAVLTNDIRDSRGNNATPSQTYHLAKRRTPWVDASGNSVYPLLPDASARAIEPLRQITQSMEFAALSAGIPLDDIVLSWTVHTQSISPTLRLLRSIAQPADTLIAPTGLSTAAVGGAGRADIYIGVITLPYYLGIPGPENPIAFLTDWWKAEPGGYIPPFNQFGLDPTSTNLTVANPFPVLTGTQTVPLLITVPNANSGLSKPDSGWPVVIYQHGLTRNRTDMLAIADTLASTGRVVISMDQPLHGVVPDVEPQLAPFYIENTPFAPLANERTFDADLVDNTTFAPGPDGLVDGSGTHSFNLANLQVLRDNIRQAEADLSILALSIQNMSLDGDATPDLDPFDVAAVSNSAGSFVMNVTTAIEPIISRMYLNAAGGGIIRTIDGGAFGPSRLHPLLAQVGLFPGTPEYEQFLILVQTLLDPADAINWAAETAEKIPVIHNQVQGDGTVPNAIPGAPLAGSEPLNRIMGLSGYSTTQVNPDGLRGVARFVQPADHESLFVPVFPQVTAEMQRQMATFIASGGTFVEVGNPQLLVPVVEVEQSEKVVSKTVGKAPVGKSRLQPVKRARD
ncbi:MAG: hypothetical protein RQ826_02880 [Xanthomonadales bacterium]|nr:hypothetical protein [Xanthomonadales bacterium]